MDVTVKCSDLAGELARAQRIVARKQTIPALSHVMLFSDGPGRVGISATDLDVALTTACPGQFGQAGATLLPALRLYELVKLLPGEAGVRVARAGKDVTVSADEFKARLQALAPEDFPALPSPDGASGPTLPADALRTMVGQVSFAVAEGDLRYYLGGALLIAAGDEVTMVATDSHRLAVSTAARPAGPDVTALVPRKALGELRALLEDQADMAFSASENHLFFTAGDRRLVCRKVDGKFPQWERIVPTDAVRRAAVDRDRLSLAVRRVALVSSQASQGARFTFAPGSLTVSANSPEFGDAVERIATAYEGPSLGVGFSARYVLDFLEACVPGDVALEIKDEHTIGIFRQLGQGPTAYFCAIAPMQG